MHQKFNAKWVVLEAKIQENREKKGSKNHVFFACVFFIDFGEVWGGFWEGFGKVLEAPWRLVGHFYVIFCKAFLPRGPKRVQEAAKRSLRLDLGQVWKGFGKVWEAKMVQTLRFLVLFWICFSRLQFWLIFVRFLITSMGGMVNQNQLRAFATVKRTEKHLIFVSERDRVFSVKPNAGKGETKTKYNKVNAKHLKFS